MSTTLGVEAVSTRGHGVVLFVVRVVRDMSVSFTAGSLLSIAVSHLPLTFAEKPQPGYHFLVESQDGPPSWDCTETISVAINFGTLSKDKARSAGSDLIASMNELEHRSAFRFDVVGTTESIPMRSWGFDYVRGKPFAKLVIFFGKENQSDLFEKGSAAMGGAFYSKVGGNQRFFAGYMLVDTNDLDDYAPGVGYRSRQALFTHELLHVLGLGHSADVDSVLQPKISMSSGTLGRSDQQGLDELSSLGCGTTTDQ